ncbi:hypothetical protein UQ17_13785 [Escherichia coli]|nr:hypothetical protein UQ17_13785 [Escherichia coli]
MFVVDRELPSRGFTTIWPPPQPVREHGSGSHPCPVAADAGIPPSDERRLVPDTYSDSFTKPESGSGFCCHVRWMFVRKAKMAKLLEVLWLSMPI